jgi:hypothetical protein
LPRFDVFIYGFGSTFLWYRELPVLKLLHKKIIYCFHGSDARPPYLDGSVMAGDRQVSVAVCTRLTRNYKARLRRIERYADVIVSHPPYAQLQERPFVSFLSLGIPMPAASPVPRELGTAVRVVHAPSHPDAKGTPEIRRIVQRLAAEGLPIEFVELSRQPNHAVRAALAGADLVLDQLYSDTPMAGLATEAAAVGCPTVVGGYEAEAILADLDDASRPPSAFCNPDAFEHEVERLVMDARARAELGAAARAFVTTSWRPASVAARYLRLASADIPESWWRSPGRREYTHGALLSDAARRALVRQVIEGGGQAALQLDDKPSLLHEIVQEAGATYAADAAREAPSSR